MANVSVTQFCSMFLVFLFFVHYFYFLALAKHVSRLQVSQKPFSLAHLMQQIAIILSYAAVCTGCVQARASAASYECKCDLKHTFILSIYFLARINVRVESQ